MGRERHWDGLCVGVGEVRHWSGCVGVCRGGRGASRVRARVRDSEFPAPLSLVPQSGRQRSLV